MDLNFLEILRLFTVFYILRYYLDSKYKVKVKSKIVIDIVLTSIVAFILQWVLGLVFN